METRQDGTAAHLSSSDVETWLNDNEDWLCDYLQRHKSVLGRTASHTVPTQCRGESTLSPWHSRTQTIAVDTLCQNVISSSSSHQHHQQQQQIQRGVTMPTRSADYKATLPSPNVFIMTSDSNDRRRASCFTPSFSTTLDASSHTNSKRHLRRHFANSRARITDNNNHFSPAAAATLTSETSSSASFDWFVSPQIQHVEINAGLINVCIFTFVLCPLNGAQNVTLCLIFHSLKKLETIFVFLTLRTQINQACKCISFMYDNFPCHLSHAPTLSDQHTSVGSSFFNSLFVKASWRTR